MGESPSSSSSLSASSLGEGVRHGNTHLIVQVLDTKALPQVSEDLGTVLFEFEMSWKVFSVEDMKMKVRGRGRRRRKGGGGRAAGGEDDRCALTC